MSKGIFVIINTLIARNTFHILDDAKYFYNIGLRCCKTCFISVKANLERGQEKK